MTLVGIKYPMSKEGGKFPATVTDEECVSNDLITLFKTATRSRVMRPTFGTNSHKLVFEPNNALFLPLGERVIKETVLFNEPRVKIENLEFIQEDNTVIADIDYSVRGIKQNLQLEIESST